LNEPVWVNLDAVLIFHEENILEFGGSSGIRDRGAIESALARPQNLFAYGQPDLFDLAAAYTAGLSQNHGFVDGNKRTAFLTGVVFLAENGYDVVAKQAEVIAAMLELADHQLDEAGYAQWLRDHAGGTRPTKSASELRRH
jgi:death-on-curing protein